MKVALVSSGREVPRAFLEENGQKGDIRKFRGAPRKKNGMHYYVRYLIQQWK